MWTTWATTVYRGVVSSIIVNIMRRFGGLRLFGVGLCGVLFLLGLAPAGASSANISHSYHATAPIANGSIVSLDPSRTDYVQAANTSNGGRLLGVAVASNDSLLAVDAREGLTQVATSGNANTLVSTLNGPIKVGDQIAVSPFNGIGMKATSGSRIIGLAQTAFDAQSQGTQTETATDKDGKQSQVTVGFVRITISVGTASAATEGTNSLQRFAKSLTGHTVSTARVVIALIVALVALVALITLTYASIYGSIISIGRNPLAKFAVFRTLSSVLLIAAATATLASITIYLLLR